MSRLGEAIAQANGRHWSLSVPVAVGENLHFEFIEPKLVRYLGYSTEGITPKSVYDLLPVSMAPHHRLWVASAIRATCLPARLKHPLRSVEVRHASGFYVHMNLNIEWAPNSSQPTFELVFAPCSSRRPLHPRLKMFALASKLILTTRLLYCSTSLNLPKLAPS